MDADRPITSRQHDRLGFAPVADRLAQTIADQSARNGMVFAIEGRWGSGKSTLINLTMEALHHLPTRPEVISFSPWLIGDRDTLLQSLFDELATAAAAIDPIASALDPSQLPRWQSFKKRFQRDAHWRNRQTQRIKQRIGRQLKAFGAFAGGVGKLAKAGTTLGVPGAAAVDRAIDSGGQAAGTFPGSQSITKRKSNLVDALRLMSRRIVVFVDDLDRLEPREASEVLRLIRAVADFPNVIYVLSYDPDVVAGTLKKAIQVDDGLAFLEKIVQASFRVPLPEAFDLRAWFRTEVMEMLGAGIEPAATSRLLQVIDSAGGRHLETPRDVVRTLNALRLHAIPVREHIDVPDMVWLQLIRVGKPLFYAWTEEYVTDVAALAAGAGISNASAQAMSDRLTQLLTEPGVDIARAIIDLSFILPGVGERGFGEERRLVFNDINDRTLAPLVTQRRLGSPQHYRYYFAFALPAGALSDAAVKAFLAVAEADPPQAIAQFAALAHQVRPQGGTMAEVLIDRLMASPERVSQAALPNVLAAFAHEMDNMARAPNDDFAARRQALRASG
jgi:hypothetical protein